jgi:NAD(P)H-hydrate epimerase
MASGGSGDVLSGVLAAVCAAHPAENVKAAAAAAWINGRAGEIAQAKNGDVSMTAGDTAGAVPEVFRELRGL